MQKKQIWIGIVFIALILVAIGWLAHAVEYMHETREPTPLEKETFPLLKKQFPGELLDTELKTLRLLSESTAYITFLEKKYPNFAPFSDFVDFDARVLPPKDRYLKFCQLYLNIPKCLYDPIDVEAEIRKRANKKYEKRL